jgi:hypothetical protein
VIDALTASRARILAAADDERRRIEQDLHDGAQQTVVVLRIHLELAAERAEAHDSDGAAALHALGTEVDEALEDIRRLTRGIYPALLSDRGQATPSARWPCALRSRPASRSHGSGAYPPEIATAVYFCCAEALQNVAKHAHGTTLAQMSVAADRSLLRFSVRHNGPGISGRETRGRRASSTRRTAWQRRWSHRASLGRGRGCSRDWSHAAVGGLIARAPAPTRNTLPRSRTPAAVEAKRPPLPPASGNCDLHGPRLRPTMLSLPVALPLARIANASASSVLFRPRLWRAPDVRSPLPSRASFGTRCC